MTNFIVSFSKSTKAAKRNQRTIDEEEEHDEHDLPTSKRSKNRKRGVPDTGADLKPNAKKKKATPKQAPGKKKKIVTYSEEATYQKKKVSTPSPKKKTDTPKKITTPSPKKPSVAATKSVVETGPPSTSDSEDGDSLYGQT